MLFAILNSLLDTIVLAVILLAVDESIEVMMLYTGSFLIAVGLLIHKSLGVLCNTSQTLTQEHYCRLLAFCRMGCCF